MKMPETTTKKSALSDAACARRAEDSHWRRQAQVRGIPAYALRLAAERRIRLHPGQPGLTYRHD